MAKKYGYSSESMRKLMSEEFQRQTEKTPYEWQLNVAKVLLLKLDSVVLVTGYYINFSHVKISC